MAGVQLNQIKAQAKMVSIPEVARQHLARTLLSHKTTEMYLNQSLSASEFPFSDLSLICELKRTKKKGESRNFSDSDHVLFFGLCPGYWGIFLTNCILTT